MITSWKSILLYITAVFATIIIQLPLQRVAAFSGSGTGINGDPFLVTSCSEFIQLSELAGTYYYSLQSDLDCSGEGASIMVGSGSTPFSGDVDGNGHTITVNININQDFVGLFKITGSANIYDLKVAGSVIGKNKVGGIIGLNTGATTLRRVANFATVGVYPDATTNTSFGGLVGHSSNASAFQNARIYDSYNAGQVGELSYDVMYVGGLVGEGNYLIIENSYNRGELFGKSPGDLAGFNSYTWSLKNNFAVGYINYADPVAKESGTGGIFTYLQYAYDAGLTTNNYFDKSRTKASKCWQNITTVPGKCETKNSTWDAPEYFKGNSTSLPFVNSSAVQVWDFSTVWEIVPDGYPALRSITGDEVATTNDNPGVPASPSGLYIPVKNNTAVTLHWTNTNDKYMDTAYFNVEYKKTTDSVWTIIDTGPLSVSVISPSLELTGLDPAALYQVRVKAFNALGASGYSDVLTFSSSVPNVLPSAPTNVVVTPQGDPLIVDLNWNVPVASGDYPIINYKIQVKYSTGTWEDLVYEATIAAPTTAVLGIPGLKNSLTYEFRVVANTAVGLGAFSAAVSYNTPLATTHYIKDCTDSVNEESFGLRGVDNDVLFRDDLFKVANDIDCTGVSFAPLAYATGGTQFEGVFDGQNFTISNVNITTFNVSENGLFARVGGAVIKNLKLEISEIPGGLYYVVGGLAGFAYGYTHVNNVDINVTISTAGTSIGGLFGKFASNNVPSLLSVSDSTVEGTITSPNKYNIGGLVGEVQCDLSTANLNCALIQNNVVSMTIQSRDSIGGLFGYTSINENMGMLITGNTFSGSIDTSGAGWGIGGLLGEFSPSYSGAPSKPIIISNNTTSGTLNAVESAGGIIGYYGDSSEGSGVVFNNNASSMTITGGAYLGGIIGSVGNYYQYSTFDSSPVSITNSSFSGSIVGDPVSGYAIGGLIGYVNVYNMSIQKCFSTGDLSGNEYIGGLLGEVYNNVSVIDSYATGDVTAVASTVGGLVGYFYGNDIDHLSVIRNSYATGAVAGTDTVGGLVGVMDWKVGIENSFFDGTVTSTAPTPTATGAIIGVSYNALSFFENVSYNMFKTASLECVGNPNTPSDFTSCLGQNVDNVTPSFYKSNVTNEPMASWNTVSVWRRMPNDYPRLRWHTINVTAPILTLTGSSSVTSMKGIVYVDDGAAAADDYDGDLTSEITVVNPVNINTTGTYYVRYNVCDSDNNCADEVTRRVDIVTNPPVITVTGSTTVTLAKGATYIDAGATALDDYDGDLTTSIVVTNPVNTNIVGTYYVLYNVCDEDGNCAVEKSRQVYVAATARAGDNTGRGEDILLEPPVEDPKTIVLKENAEYLAGIAVLYALKENDNVIAQIGKDNYALNIAEIGDNYVTLTGNKGENTLIEFGQKVRLDLDGDTIVDLEIQLTDIVAEKAELTFLALNLTVTTTPPSASPTPVTTLLVESPKKLPVLLWILLIIPIGAAWLLVKTFLIKRK